jgi:hypothetical protein
MDETFEKEIQRLKAELLARKDDLEDIRTLVKQEIDREFHPDAMGLTEREIEKFIELRLAVLLESHTLEAEPMPPKSHRKVFGRPVLFLKKVFQSWADIYAKAFLDKQNLTNQASLDLIKVLILRSRWSREKLRDLDQRVVKCEEDLVIMINKVQDLRARLEKAAKTPDER